MGVDGRSPLPKELFYETWEDTKRYIGLEDRRRALGFLEDRLAHIFTSVGSALEGDDVLRDYFISFLERNLLLNKFYGVTLLRYLNKTIGSPKLVQHLNDYRTEGGNQVDLYLKEYFGC